MLRRFIVAQIKNEVYAAYAGENCTSQIGSAVAWELDLVYNMRNASITIGVGVRRVTMVINFLLFLDQELLLGTDNLYLLDNWFSIHQVLEG